MALDELKNGISAVPVAGEILAGVLDTFAGSLPAAPELPGLDAIPGLDALPIPTDSLPGLDSLTGLLDGPPCACAALPCRHRRLPCHLGRCGPARRPAGRLA